LGLCFLAYGVNEEVHREGRTLQQECLIKFVGILKQRDIQFIELFNMCDVNDDGMCSCFFLSF
jgi:hypothetical protein